MNRIETRIIVMVTDRLSAARNSEAKNELIEELSENLYQRYEDLRAEGLSEEDALQQAMDSLGDTDELIAYLRSIDGEDCGTQGYHGEETWEDLEGRARDRGSYSSYNRKKSSFFGRDLENGIEDMVNAAMSAARNAAGLARDAAKDVSEQFRERYPDGFTWQFNSQQSGTVECTSFPSESIHSLEVRLVNGDVDVQLVEDPNAPVEVEGDAEYIQTMLQEDGVLRVKQENTASSSVLFNRGVVMMAPNVEIRIPRKVWDSVSLATVNGDVSVEQGLECQTLSLQSQSGDLELSDAVSNTIRFHSTSGDITGRRLKGDVQADSKSGDVELDGWLGRCAAASISGDIDVTGVCSELSGSSTSGNVDVNLDTLPVKTKVTSISGDCSVHIPRENGFRLSYHTTSGEFSTDLTLSGTYRGKRGELSYLDGGNSLIQLSSVSGDLEVYGK